MNAPYSTKFSHEDTMSERDRINYLKIKADPEKYRAYLDRKRRERNRKQSERGYETLRKRQWRAKNPDAAQRIRRANHAVEWALNSGKIVRLGGAQSWAELGSTFGLSAVKA